MKLNYVYHIHYMTENNYYGDCTIYRAKKINTDKELDAVRKLISETYCNNKTALICNFILLNKRGV